MKKKKSKKLPLVVFKHYGIEFPRDPKTKRPGTQPAQDSYDPDEPHVPESKKPKVRQKSVSIKTVCDKKY